ncbi:MAG: DUF3450 domain-containing protein [Proteobacteria bacterium]|nr:DUF3450 domain-containing protein [Pseudomonadota bacterium]
MKIPAGQHSFAVLYHYHGCPKRYVVNKRQIVRMFIFPLLLLLWGCSESTLTFQVRYAEILGLKQDDPIYFQQNVIGKAQKISYTQQGDYLVVMSISPEFKNAATQDSKFFIDDDPRNQQSKAVIILQERPGGKVIEQGSIVQGAVKTGFLNDLVSGFKRSANVAENEMRQAVQQLEKSLITTSEKLDKEMAGMLDDLSLQFQMLNKEVRRVPDRQEVQQLVKSLRQFVEELNKAQNDVRDHILDEVMPQLRKELDRLRELLHQEGRDKEIEEIDYQVNEMSRV